jgi:hypothetical protein
MHKVEIGRPMTVSNPSLVAAAVAGAKESKLPAYRWVVLAIYCAVQSMALRESLAR